MSQSLRRDLELLATFDSDHTDAANGVVKDFSGKERHLQASGGPTYGESSPVGEAVAFDGTDDFFKPTGLEDGVFKDESFTNATLARYTGPDDGNGRIYSQLRSTGDRIQYNNEFTNIKYIGIDRNSDLFILEKDTDMREYTLVVSQYDAENDVHRVAVDGEVGDTAEGIGHETATGGNADYHLGADFDGGFTSAIDVAFNARWSRALSDAEIEELNRMTDRMVSKL